MLLLGCASLLLGMEGCSQRTLSLDVGEESSAKERAAGKSSKGGAEKESPFRLPADAAGVLLATEVAPRAHPRPLRTSTRPGRPDVPMPRFAEVRLPLPTAPADLVRLPSPVRKALARPEFVQEEALEESFLEPVLPQKPRFMTSRPLRVPSEDAALPPPLPLMAQQVPDRVSLEDATMEASTAAVLSAAPRPRQRPAPYQRMSVPEPYEHRRPLTLLVPPERTTPQTL
jgi:hypothetical protein